MADWLAEVPCPVRIFRICRKYSQKFVYIPRNFANNANSHKKRTRISIFSANKQNIAEKLVFPLKIFTMAKLRATGPGWEGGEREAQHQNPCIVMLTSCSKYSRNMWVFNSTTLLIKGGVPLAGRKSSNQTNKTAHKYFFP